jgi:nucleotide-binding universal stress UspA family protein
MAPPLYDSILLPTDGSDGANRAAEHALNLAERYDADLHAVFIVDSHRYGEPALSTTELVIEQIAEEGEQYLDELVDRADNRGIEVTTHSRRGHPHQEILDVAAAVDADLVVMGYQGQTHHEHIGSTTDRVVRACTRPVLVV